MAVDKHGWPQLIAAAIACVAAALLTAPSYTFADEPETAQALEATDTAAPAHAAGVRGELRLPEGALLVAQVAEVRWQLEVPTTTEVVEIGLHDAPHVELVERSWEREGEQVEVRVSLLIARPGTYPVGGIRLITRAAQGDRSELRSAGFEVEVTPLLDPIDASEPPSALALEGAEIPKVVHPYIRGGALALGLLLVLALVIGRSNVEEVAAEQDDEPAPDPIDPVGHLRDALDRLLNDEDGAAQAPLDWHQELSDALRVYLAGTTSPGAREQTTSEIDAALRSSGALRPELHNRFIQVLRATDLVKFGGFKPAVDWSMRVGRDADAFFMRLEKERRVRMTADQSEEQADASEPEEVAE